MAFTDITSEAVILACNEFDEIGRERFLEKYGFGPAKKFFLLHNNRKYDSKAIVGAAHGYIGNGNRPLRNDEFSGGRQQAVRVLEDLGFEVRAEGGMPVSSAVQNAAKVGSGILRELLSSEDPIEQRLAQTLIYWQEAKRRAGRRANLGREPSQIRREGARAVIEGRVISRASGFDEVATSDESYERIVADFPDQFSEKAVAAARKRLAEYDLASPTDDLAELERKAQEILARPHMISLPPTGNSTPEKRTVSAGQYARDPRVVAYTLQRASGRCELCGSQAPFRKDDGSPYLETHHVMPLADGGPDVPDNCAGVCPNCHRALHSSKDRGLLAQKLRASVSGSLATWPASSMTRN